MSRVDELLSVMLHGKEVSVSDWGIAVMSRAGIKFRRAKTDGGYIPHWAAMIMAAISLEHRWSQKTDLNGAEVEETVAFLKLTKTRKDIRDAVLALISIDEPTLPYVREALLVAKKRRK